MSRKWVYSFSAGQADGAPGDRETLGAKGDVLAELSRLGLPVPAGFTVGAPAGLRVNPDIDVGLSPEVEAEIRESLARLESLTGRRLGDRERPLLLAVRAGARVSMPEIRATLLDVGLTPEVIAGLAEEAGDRRFAEDCHRRFLRDWGEVVLGLRPDGSGGLSPFDAVLYDVRRAYGARDDSELGADGLAALAQGYRRVMRDKRGVEPPEDPVQQVLRAVQAAFASWHWPESRELRRRHGYPDDWGTAVHVVQMVYGNRPGSSGSGLAFTHDAATGARRFHGEFLPGAQGEDVVAGVRLPIPLSAEDAGVEGRCLSRDLPSVYGALGEAAARLEARFRDALDLEFTVEDGRLYLLNVRPARPSPEGAVRLAVDLATESVLTRSEAVARLDARALGHLLAERRRAVADDGTLARGLAASPGVATGAAAFSVGEVLARRRAGQAVIFVRAETSTDDVRGMQAADGIVTARGGLTCHAAIVARAMNLPCVVGASELRVDARAGTASARGRTIREGETLTVDGRQGLVTAGSQPADVEGRVPGLEVLMSWIEDLLAERGLSAEGELTERLERLQASLAGEARS